jgi:hypothetical protein
MKRIHAMNEVPDYPQQQKQLTFYMHINSRLKIEADLKGFVVATIRQIDGQWDITAGPSWQLANLANRAMAGRAARSECN